MDHPARLSIGVIGAGRVGAVLGAALSRAGHHVQAAYAVSDESRDRAAALLPGVPLKDVPDVIDGADLVLLAVPDDALAELVRGLAATDAWQAGQIVVHTSGRHGIGILRPAMSAHILPLAIRPAMTFTGTALDLGRLEECAFGVSGPEALRPMAEALVVEMGGDPVWIAEEQRSAYHAGLAHGSNHLVTLVAEAMEVLRAAGVENPRAVLGPLTRAALDNALKIVDKRHADIKVVVAGVGAAGVAVSKILMNAGVVNVIGVDRVGAVYDGRGGLNSSKQWFAENTNPTGLKGSISDVIAGADVFIGLSGPDLLSVEDVKSMATDPIVFAMANPDPEIRPELIQDIAAVIATGRSDFPNQINNVLAFPGIFRGAFDAGARRITENMKVAAAHAIAEVVGDQVRPDFIIPSVFDPRVVTAVAEASRVAAIADGVCRPPLTI